MHFSPLPMKEGENASLSREITPSLSEEDDAKRGERMKRKELRFGGHAGALTPAIQQTVPSRAVMLTAGLLTTRAREQ